MGLSLCCGLQDIAVSLFEIAKFLCASVRIIFCPTPRKNKTDSINVANHVLHFVRKKLESEHVMSWIYHVTLYNPTTWRTYQRTVRSNSVALGVALYGHVRQKSRDEYVYSCRQQNMAASRRFHLLTCRWSSCFVFLRAVLVGYCLILTLNCQFYYISRES